MTRKSGTCRDPKTMRRATVGTGVWGVRRHRWVWVGAERGTLADWPQGDGGDVGQYIARACVYTPMCGVARTYCEDLLWRAAVSNELCKCDLIKMVEITIY